MAQDPLAGLAAFAATAEARSFSRAAERLGVSPSALSHAMRGLEERLGVRLLARTTRSVAVTEAGERLLATLRPALADIAAGLEAARTVGGAPAGTVRLTAVKHAVTSVLAPLLPGFLARFPGIRIEVDADDGLTDIVAKGYDAGIRFGGLVDRDMVSLRIGPRIESAVVASPGYLAGRAPPLAPRDLGEHRCILHRRPHGAGTYPWRFEEEGRVTTLRVEGALAFSDSDLVLALAVAGQGLAYVFADSAAEALAEGRLVRLLEPFTATLPGYEIYYPSRRQNPAALVALLGALREARAAHDA